VVDDTSLAGLGVEERDVADIERRQRVEMDRQPPSISRR
jgi:hypothetical protein